jgi:hypothetical protein
MIDDEAMEASLSAEEEEEEQANHDRAESPAGSTDTQVIADNIQRTMSMPSVHQASQEEQHKLTCMMRHFQDTAANVTRLGQFLDNTDSQFILHAENHSSMVVLPAESSKVLHSIALGFLRRPRQSNRD